MAYKNVVSPWVSLSDGKAEIAWLRADGHVDVLCFGAPTNFGNLWTTVAPPPGERYVAVSSGAGHLNGTSVSYLLRDSGAVDRRSTSRPSPMHTSTRTEPKIKTLLPLDASAKVCGKYVCMSAGYYATFLVRDDGAVDVLSETTVQKGKPTQACAMPIRDETILAGALACTIPAPAGTAYVGVSSQPAMGAVMPPGKTDGSGGPKLLSSEPKPRILIRADGRVDYTTADGLAVGTTLEPPGGADAGRKYVSAACGHPGESGEPISLLVRSDGAVDIVQWTGTGGALLKTLTPPEGQRYLSASAGGYLVRSDGCADILHYSICQAGIRQHPYTTGGTSNPRFGQITQTIAPQDPAPAGGCCSVQ